MNDFVLLTLGRQEAVLPCGRGWAAQPSGAPRRHKTCLACRRMESLRWTGACMRHSAGCAYPERKNICAKGSTKTRKSVPIRLDWEKGDG